MVPTDPVARDAFEAELLRAIGEAPDDDGHRLVYADWLEARGELQRADFLRTLCKLALPTVNRKKIPQLQERLVRLSSPADVLWRALVSRPAIDGCAITFRFKCPKRWTALAPTEQPNVRRCGACERDVHFCGTLEELRARAQAGDCVAFDPALRSRDAFAAFRRAAPRSDDELELGEIRGA
jgi:uncharacterized protein (TIGR02996 family)